jgi:hypothetical protein
MLGSPASYAAVSASNASAAAAVGTGPHSPLCERLLLELQQAEEDAAPVRAEYFLMRQLKLVAILHSI